MVDGRWAPPSGCLHFIGRCESGQNKQCDKCQGDCDNDDGCKGSLKCFHRSKNGKEDVDGCQSGGRSADDRKNVGYCY